MSRLDAVRECPKSQVRFGLYNYGNLWSVHHYRRDAVRQAEDATGKPWGECRAFMEIHKVRVEVYAP